jgi:hypothetical protein
MSAQIPSADTHLNEHWETIKTNQSNSINTQLPFPSEIILNILSFLPSPEDLARASMVCKEFKMISEDSSLWEKFNLMQLFNTFKSIDQSVWEKHVDLQTMGLQIKEAPLLDKRVAILILKRLYSSPLVDKEAGVTYLVIPEGLSLNKLEKIAAAPKLGHPTKFTFVWTPVNALGDLQVAKVRAVFITNAVLKGSRNQPILDQERMVKTVGGTLPDTLAMSALCMMTYITSTELPPTRLFNNNPETFTQCVEKIDESFVTVGNYERNGLSILPMRFKKEGLGVAACINQALS